MLSGRRSTASTSLLSIDYETTGDASGPAVILLHGFPYDVRAYDDVAEIVGTAGALVVAPYLRGFGRTRFLDENTPRSGQQAALGQDLIDLLDALDIETAVVAGYDWGGRAACIAAALFPERVTGLVTVDGYTIQDIAHADSPSLPEWEKTYWYQYYFHSPRGRRGLAENREALCELLWRDWSPTWLDATKAFPASAVSLHNPDFVDVVIHSYRHRFGLEAGDPRYDELEQRLAADPTISVPTVVVESGADGVAGAGAAGDRDFFTGKYEHRLLPNIGHNVPQEDPEAFAQAVLSLLP
ncbi:MULTISPECIES: alpha/beta fold hydrolase [unclassified Rathayibacter]|uniref:alpha/beta fold hydrolase n=1 Tax=unclassified Rathayibacter TaxID=2609250 RepID=UPI00188B17AF|nr:MULTISPECIES: alpha/beta hydrolase [unclassified Rathayibacter]MBF4462094.1 alpha/beta hydrolase [Rathayibacter sp. VKM Ac-2879]MBF4503863.1 alpha/beta hydrolase [Rathayibacter sp. VKM Ac-2878]